MGEVETMLLGRLRRAGLDTDATSLVDLSLQEYLGAVHLLLLSVGASPPDGSERLSSNMSQRYRLAGDFVTLVSSLGYRGQLGYEAFLYPSDSDMKQVLLFLTELAPTRKTVESEAVTESGGELKEQLRLIFVSELAKVFVPPRLRSRDPTSLRHVSRSDRREKLRFLCHSAAVSAARLHSTQQVDPATVEQLSAAIVATPTKKESGLKTTEVVTPSTQPTVAEDEDQSVDNTQVEQEQVEELEKRERDLTTRVETVRSEVSRVVELAAAAERWCEGQVELINSKAVVAQSLQEEDAIARLQHEVTTREQKLTRLHDQWSGRRREVEEETALLGDSEQKAEVRRLKTLAADLLETRVELELQQRIGEKRRAELQRQLAAGGDEDSSTRLVWTSRVMELSKQLTRQRAQLDKVLEETRGLQKQLNLTQGRLERAYSALDNGLFPVARSDATIKRAYIMLTKMHTDFAMAFDGVDQLWRSSRETTQLEDRAAALPQRPMAAVTQDTARVLEENANLRRKLGQQDLPLTNDKQLPDEPSRTTPASIADQKSSRSPVESQPHSAVKTKPADVVEGAGEVQSADVAPVFVRKKKEPQMSHPLA